MTTKSNTARYPELKNKVAVVTGAALGIGQSIAMRFAREGMRVALVDKNPDALQTTIALFQESEANVAGFVVDLAQKEAIEPLFTDIMNVFGTVDVLVNNAADLRRFRLLDDHDDILENQLAVNIRAPYLCSQHAARIMRDAGGGNIIHISSVGGIRAHNRGLPYDVTKGAIDSLTQAMAIDLAEYNIRVNAIAPGATLTYRSTPNSDMHKVMAERIPMKRFGTTSEISAVAAFLASNEASYITGQTIYVDGGITTQLSPPGQNL